MKQELCPVLWMEIILWQAGSILGNLWRSSLIVIWKFFSIEPMHGISFHCACTNCICIEVKKRISSKENKTLTEKWMFSLIYPLFTWFMVLILKRHVCERMFELTEICTLLKKGADPKETILLLNISVTWCHFRENDIPTHPPINSIPPIPASLNQLPRHCNEKKWGQNMNKSTSHSNSCTWTKCTQCQG